MHSSMSIVPDESLSCIMNSTTLKSFLGSRPVCGESGRALTSARRIRWGWPPLALAPGCVDRGRRPGVHVSTALACDLTRPILTYSDLPRLLLPPSAGRWRHAPDHFGSGETSA